MSDTPKKLDMDPQSKLKSELKDLLLRSLEMLGRSELDIRQWEECAQVEMREALDAGGSDDGIMDSADLRHDINDLCEDIKRILGLTGEYEKAAANREPMIECPQCLGTGGNGLISCNWCRGKGEVPVQEDSIGKGKT